MQIDWWTLAIQAVNFLILVWLLSRVLFRPVRKVVAQRQARSAEALEAAKAREDEADKARQDYEAKAQDLARERRDMAAELHKKADAERERMLAAAEEEADRMRADARDGIAAERDRALEALRGDVAEMAADMAGRLLKETGAPQAGEASRAAIAAHLDGLAEEARAELSEDAGGGVRVVTAAALDDGARNAWTEAVRGWFGDGVDVSFEEEPDLLGGVDLRLPHAVLEFSWAGRLRDAAGRMAEGGDGA